MHIEKEKLIGVFAALLDRIESTQAAQEKAIAELTNRLNKLEDEKET